MAAYPERIVCMTEEPTIGIAGGDDVFPELAAAIALSRRKRRVESGLAGIEPDLPRGAPPFKMGVWPDCRLAAVSAHAYRREATRRFARTLR